QFELLLEILFPGLRLDVVQPLAVTFVETFCEFVRFWLFAPPANDFRLERWLTVLIVPPFAPSVPVFGEICSSQSHERNLGPPARVGVVVIKEVNHFR